MNIGPGPGSGIPPVFDTEALEALIAKRVAAAIALYDSQRPDGSDPWDSAGGSRETADHARSYKHFRNCKPQSFFEKRGRRRADSIIQEDGISLSDKLSCTRRSGEVRRLYFCKHCTILVEQTRLDNRQHRGKLYVMGRVKNHDVRRVLPKEGSAEFGARILEPHYKRLRSESLHDTTHRAGNTVLRNGDPCIQENRTIHMGLALQIRGMVTTSRPVTFESAKSNDVRLTDQGMRRGSIGRKADPPLGESNKRKSWEISHDEDKESDPKNEGYEGNDSGIGGVRR
ncbi:hypothetical protein LXL04_038963 [Taraxacum kok-saghyz]